MSLSTSKICILKVVGSVFCEIDACMHACIHIPLKYLVNTYWLPSLPTIQISKSMPQSCKEENEKNKHLKGKQAQDVYI